MDQPAQFPHAPSPGVVVRGLSVTGRVLAAAPLPHGADPAGTLLAHGARVAEPIAAARAGNHLTVDFRAEPATAVAAPLPVPRRDPSLVRGEDEPAVPYQRVAAYALVESARGLLLTVTTSRAHAGVWALPGGGVEAGEEPEDACRRELWEETGQRIEIGGLVQVQSDHWIGRAPHGRLEDFHALRLIYAATCADPGDPVVQEVGGTTLRAAWFDAAALRAADLSRPVRTALARRGHHS